MMAGEEIVSAVASDPYYIKYIVFGILIGIFFTVVNGILGIILRIQEFLVYRELKQYDVITYKRFKPTTETVWWKRMFR